MYVFEVKKKHSEKEENKVYFYFRPFLNFPTTYTCRIRRVKSALQFPEFWFVKIKQRLTKSQFYKK